MNKSIHLYISGMVQGVGYRQFVRYVARKLGVTGWVQNLPDGRVEAMVHGSEDQLKELIRRCKKGSFVSEVKDIDVIWMENEETFDGFEIRK